MIDDLWYKNAVVYTLNVGSFMDSNGDGIGDFEGLSRRLDYLSGLGISCLWLQPFQPSPYRDAGYDLRRKDAFIVALNCGTRMDMTRAKEAVERYKSVTDLPVMAQPNAGQPKLVNMKVIYDETPEEMVKGVIPLLKAGASIVGACCGSTPDHIRAFRGAMNEFLATRSIPQPV